MLLTGLTVGCASDPSISGNERQSKPGNFGIVSYNVLYGFNHGKRLKLGADWINEQKPNVVALQELNGFNKKKLEETAALWGHRYSEILKERGFPVGLTSREPIETIEKRLKGMHHGFLHCKTSGMNFIVVHLAPFDFRKRQKEAYAICAKVRDLIESNEMFVVLGDFNAVSPLGSCPRIAIFSQIEECEKNYRRYMVDIPRIIF
ncbi:MAG: endonuclease/exonuclease/phosphatase family protein [Thermodesulfobacteriota bacterium]|nr:endonuclease/exonuclease/phosphatase family protein [Thermodesulfobacteriota bacterium]